MGGVLLGFSIIVIIFGLSLFAIWQRLNGMRKEDGMIDINLLHKFMMKFMILYFIFAIIAAILLFSLRDILF